MLSGISTISFDLDDTLWDNQSVILRARENLYQKMTELYPLFSDRFSEEKFTKLGLKLYAEKNWKCDLTALRKSHIKTALEQTNCATDRINELSDYYLYWRNQLELFSGVEKTLERLASRFSLIAITNGNANLNEIGIGQYFQFTVCAADVGEKKPSTKIFQFAIDQLNQKAKSIVHVGDKFDEDVEGAINSGMKAIWCNRHLQASNKQPTGLVGTITSINELLL